MQELKGPAVKPVRGRPFTAGDPRTGRRPGTKNNITKAMKKVYLDAFLDLQKDPQHSLLTWARKHPTEFYKLAARIIPDQVRQSLFFHCKIQSDGI